VAIDGFDDVHDVTAPVMQHSQMRTIPCVGGAGAGRFGAGTCSVHDACIPRYDAVTWTVLGLIWEGVQGSRRSDAPSTENAGRRGVNHTL
jgi:hypothetical protein